MDVRAIVDRVTRDAVEAGYAGGVSYLRTAAAEWIHANGRAPGNADLRAIRLEAQKMDEAAWRAASRGLESRGLERVTSQELVRFIDGPVRRLRRDLWTMRRGEQRPSEEYEQPLFQEEDYATEAVPWLERQIREGAWSQGWEDPRDYEKEHSRVTERRDELLSEIWKRIHELERLTGERAFLDDEDPAFNDFEYVDRLDREGRRTRKWLGPHHQLLHLSRESRRLSIITGFPPFAIVAHILCGFEPVLARAKVEPSRRLHAVDDIHFRRSEVVVTLYTPRLRQEEAWELSRLISGAWDDATRQTVSEKEAHLREVLVDMNWQGPGGGRAPRGFWDRVAERWTEETGEDVYPHALHERSRRLAAKLPELLPVEKVA